MINVKLWLCDYLGAKLPNNCKIKPEERICLELASEMRALTLEGKYNGIWFHVPNEGRRSKIAGQVLKCLGLHSGVADYVYVWYNGAYFAEMKYGKNKQSERQRLFERWACDAGLNYGVHYDAASVINKLKQLGAIKCQ